MTTRVQVGYEALAKGVDLLGMYLLLDLTDSQAKLDIQAATVTLVTSGRRASLEHATCGLLHAMRNCPHPGLREIARNIRVP